MSGTVTGQVVGALVWIALGLAAGGVLCVMRSRALGTIWLALVVVVVVAWNGSLHVKAQFASGIGEAVTSGEIVVVEGVVVSDPNVISPGPFRLSEPRWMASVVLSAITVAGGERHAVRSFVRAAGPGWADVQMGDRVTLEGTLEASTPGRAAAIMWDAHIVSVTGPSGVDSWVRTLRDGLRRSASGLSPDIGPLTVGMTIGDTRGMPAEQERDMRVASLTHLTAVSGAQFAMIAFAVGAGTRALRWRRWTRAVTVTATLAGFMLLVGPEASVLRAAAMGAVVALAVGWGRSAQALPALAAAIVALLILDPFLALSYGFALSVAATAAITLWSPALALYLARAVPARLARAMSVPIAAQVMTTPIVVLFSGGVGPYGVVANLVAVPFAVAVTALGLLATCVAPVCPPAGVALAWLAGQAARPVAWAAHTVADLPGAWVSWPIGVGGAAIAAAIATAMVCATCTRRTEGRARIGAVIAVVTIVLGSPSVRAASERSGPEAPADWAFAACDVGQGDMILLRAGPHSAVVVDVGPPQGGAAGCLARHGVSDVPLLILTHPHADHDGGLAEVLDEVDVAAAWVSEPGVGGPADHVLRRAGVPPTVPLPGTRATVGATHLTVWHGPTVTGTTDSLINDSSLALWGSADGVTFLEMGDLEVEGQRGLAAATAGSGVIDVLKVAHHGSAVRDPDAFVHLRPSVAVISVGVGNPYGHPAESTLDALDALGALVVRTDQCGDVNVSARGHVVVTSQCPLPVARLTHATTKEADDRRLVGRRPPASTRSGGGSRGPSCGSSHRSDRRRGQGGAGLRRHHRPICRHLRSRRFARRH